MAVILSAPTFNWSLARERICDKALEKVNELGVGETASTASRGIALEALDGILKMLQFQGLSWPLRTSGRAELIVYSGELSTALPADYYGEPEIQVVSVEPDASGVFPTGVHSSYPLILLQHAEWMGMDVGEPSTSTPAYGYIDTQNVLWVLPAHEKNAKLLISYTKVIPDSASGTSPGSGTLQSPWMLALPWGVAAEIAEEFEVPVAKIQRIEMKWQYYLNLCLMNSAPAEPRRMSIASVDWPEWLEVW